MFICIPVLMVLGFLAVRSLFESFADDDECY